MEKENVVSVNVVLKTIDYSIFVKIDGNRRMNKINFKRLRRSMGEEYLQVPIIINEKYEVIDGQHRLEVCKELSLPVYFIKVKGYGLSQVHRLNAVSKKWGFDEYLQGYADLGIKDYQRCEKFIEKYKFGSNETLSLLTGLNSLAGGDARNSFNEGRFKITDYNGAVRKAEMIYMLKPYYDGFKRRSFVTALLVAFNNKNFVFDEFLKKLKFQIPKLIDCTTTKQYMTVVENIYNYKRKQEDKIRLF